MNRFAFVEPQHKRNFEVFTSEKGVKHHLPLDVKLPEHKTDDSAGSDFFLPKDISFLPKTTTLIYTDVICNLEKGEFLSVHIRSSLGIKYGLELANGVGIIDADYAHNPENGGNIILAIYNRSGTTYEAKAGERIAQGIIQTYKRASDENITETRTGGVGSTGK